MVCSPLRTQRGSQASGNRLSNCCLIKGVQTSESAQPIRLFDVEKSAPEHGLRRYARARGPRHGASATGIRLATVDERSGSRRVTCVEMG